ncbi:MAG: hypothetical protein AB7F35_12200 [Acetobacteraceae bacterium]
MKEPLTPAEIDEIADRLSAMFKEACSWMDSPASDGGEVADLLKVVEFLEAENGSNVLVIQAIRMAAAAIRMREALTPHP